MPINTKPKKSTRQIAVDLDLPTWKRVNDSAEARQPLPITLTRWVREAIAEKLEREK